MSTFRSHSERVSSCQRPTQKYWKGKNLAEVETTAMKPGKWQGSCIWHDLLPWTVDGELEPEQILRSSSCLVVFFYHSSTSFSAFLHHRYGEIYTKFVCRLHRHDAFPLVRQHERAT